MPNVILQTTEYGITTERIVPIDFALRQLDAGFDRVSIVDMDFDTVIATSDHIDDYAAETFSELFDGAADDFAETASDYLSAR